MLECFGGICSLILQCQRVSQERKPPVTHTHTPNHEYMPARQKREVDVKTAG